MSGEWGRGKRSRKGRIEARGGSESLLQQSTNLIWNELSQGRSPKWKLRSFYPAGEELTLKPRRADSVQPIPPAWLCRSIHSGDLPEISVICPPPPPFLPHPPSLPRALRSLHSTKKQLMMISVQIAQAFVGAQLLDDSLRKKERKKEIFHIKKKIEQSRVWTCS